MIDFIIIKDWRKVWQLCDETGDVSRLFDDKVPYSRQGMKHRIRDMVENQNNKAFEILYDGAKAGCFILFDLKDGIYEVHVLLKEGFRGRKAGTEFSLSLPNVANLVSFCPDTLRESFVFALRCGWRSLGILPIVWRKQGVDYAVKGVAAI